jgi:hypothetical protein
MGNATTGMHVGVSVTGGGTEALVTEGAALLCVLRQAVAMVQELGCAQRRRGDVSAWCGGAYMVEQALCLRHCLIHSTRVFIAQLPFDMPLSSMQDVCDAVVPGPTRVHVVAVEPHFQRAKRDRYTTDVLLSGRPDTVGDGGDDDTAAANGGGGTARDASGRGAVHIGAFSISPTFRGYAGVVFVRLCLLDARRVIAAFHKRVLFDVDGAWAARTAAQERHLAAYCGGMQDLGWPLRHALLPYRCPFATTTAELEGRRPMPPCVHMYRAQLEREVVAHAAPPGTGAA